MWHVDLYSNSDHRDGIASFSQHQSHNSSSLCLLVLLPLRVITSNLLWDNVCFAVLLPANTVNNNSVVTGWRHCLMRNTKGVICLLSKFQGLLINRMESSQNSLSHNSGGLTSASLWACRTVFLRLVNTGGRDPCNTPSLEVCKTRLEGVLINLI